jgi:hypothetical protein
VLFNRASLERVLRAAGFEPHEQPPPSPQALQIFSQSAAIREGRLPDEGPSAGPGRLRPLATIANRAALQDPRHAEELVIIAARPPRRS